MKYILFIFFTLLSICSSAEKQIQIRFNQEFVDVESQSVYVAIELAVENSSLVLADQNYRLYFNSADLKFNGEGSSSDLPLDKYSSIDFLERIEGVNVQGTNQLSFDEDMGFINFKIDLLDDNNGGVVLSSKDGWQKIAILKFDILNDSKEENLVWSQPHITDEYATAFVEITEWIAPFENRNLEVSEYGDAQVTLNSITAPINIAVGPNPTADFIKIELSDAFQSPSTIMVTDASGQVRINQAIPLGTDSMTINIDSLPSTMYVVEVIDNDNTLIYSDKLIVVD